MSFENISEKEKNTNIFLFALYTFISFISIFFLPFIGFLGLAFLAVPVTTMVLKKETGKAIWSILLAVVIVALINYLLAIVIVAMIFMIAYFYRYCKKEGKGALFSFSGIAGIMIVSVLLYMLLFSFINGFNAFSEIIKEYNSYVDNILNDPLFRNYKSLTGTEGTDFEAVVAQLQTILKFIPRLLPGMLLGFIGLSSVLNHKFTYNFAKRFGVVIRDIRSFKQWDLNWNFCWGIILGLTLILIPEFNPVFDPVFDLVGANFLIIFGIIYSVLGISVIWSLFDRFKLNMVLRVIILILIFVFFGLVLVPILMGLIDIWANFRKLKRK